MKGARLPPSCFYSSLLLPPPYSTNSNNFNYNYNNVVLHLVHFSY